MFLPAIPVRFERENSSLLAEMAPRNLQEVIEALRHQYGPSDVSIKLSELLFFLGSLQDSLDHAF